MAVTWDAAFEALPAGSDSPTFMALGTRTLKTAIRERLELEHDWQETGAHPEGKTRIHATDTAPTDPPNGTVHARLTTPLTVQVRSADAWRGLYQGTHLSSNCSSRAAAFSALLPFVPNVGDKRPAMGRFFLLSTYFACYIERTSTTDIVVSVGNATESENEFILRSTNQTAATIYIEVRIL